MTSKADQIRAYLTQHPTASPALVARTLGVSRQQVSFLALREFRDRALPQYIPPAPPKQDLWRICEVCGDRRPAYDQRDAEHRLCRLCYRSLSRSPDLLLTCDLCGMEFERKGRSATRYRHNHRQDLGRGTWCPACYWAQFSRPPGTASQLP